MQDLIEFCIWRTTWSKRNGEIAYIMKAMPFQALGVFFAFVTITFSSNILKRVAMFMCGWIEGMADIQFPFIVWYVLPFMEKKVINKQCLLTISILFVVIIGRLTFIG